MSHLYIVATPIGNLEDITLRALRILKEVDVICAEDTRVSRKLLAQYNISTPLERLDAQTEEGKVNKILAWLEAGKSIAVVSDAGTPAISDPGARLVERVRERGHHIMAIPGPSALTAALSVAGVIAPDFVFLGFIPHKKGRQTLFNEIASSKRTMVFYESPHRILKTLEALDAVLEETRKVIVARELTKLYEEVISDTPSVVSSYFKENREKVKGEFVVVVEGKEK